MNGHTNSSPELPLPMPGVEQGVRSHEGLNSVESKASRGDAVSQGPSAPMPLVDPAQFAGAPSAVVAQITDDQSAQAGADDADVIEKEWVNRAKAIVNSTRDNPAKQTKELSKFKAEYIKKRFNKEIKTAKEVTDES